MSHPKQGGLALTDTKAERRTASDCIRTYKPKGVATASNEGRRAYAMHMRGWKNETIARRMGVPVKRVLWWLGRVEEALADARHLEALR